eukprot:XP_001698075.1 predicted protein [Chlamydomonas reinhardtii]
MTGSGHGPFRHGLSCTACAVACAVVARGALACKASHVFRYWSMMQRDALGQFDVDTVR